MSWIKKENFTHTDAVREIYKYTPQIRDYDQFMHIGARWLPYTMYFHNKNFISSSVNTDTLGFRYSYLHKKRYSVAELPDNKSVNLLVGGSTALGVGSTHDAYTVASFLSELTGDVWLNFSGRGYNAVQELIMFLMHQDKFSQISRVIILSGINTLALEGLPDDYSSDHGRYYYSYEFQHYMNKFNEDMKRKKNSFNEHSNSKLFSLRKWKEIFNKHNPADEIITDEDIPLEARIERAAKSIAKTLNQWNLLLAGFNAPIDFILQPLCHWCRPSLTPDEERVFYAIDNCPNNFYRLFGGILGTEVHLPFFKKIVQHSANVPCHNMNTLLPKSEYFNDTIFVDRVHFNDLGNYALAKLIKNNILIRS
jgi:hypothetical protein